MMGLWWWMAVRLASLIGWGVAVIGCINQGSNSDQTETTNDKTPEPVRIEEGEGVGTCPAQPVDLWGLLDRSQMVVLSKTPRYTQGLVYTQGMLVESAGLFGQSALVVHDLAQGRERVVYRFAEAEQPEDRQVFAEGLAIWQRDELVQLTWQAKRAFRYPLAAVKEQAKVSPQQQTYANEGWGLTAFGEKLVASDATNVYFVDGQTLGETSQMVVRENGDKVTAINEMETIGDHIWANLYRFGDQERLIRFRGSDGCVDGELRLQELFSYTERRALKNTVTSTDSDHHLVANGIAYGENTLYLTGKNWDRIYAIPFRSPATNQEVGDP